MRAKFQMLVLETIFEVAASWHCLDPEKVAHWVGPDSPTCPSSMSLARSRIRQTATSAISTGGTKRHKGSPQIPFTMPLPPFRWPFFRAKHTREVLGSLCWAHWAWLAEPDPEGGSMSWGGGILYQKGGVTSQVLPRGHLQGPPASTYSPKQLCPSGRIPPALPGSVRMSPDPPSLSPVSARRR